MSYRLTIMNEGVTRKVGRGQYPYQVGSMAYRYMLDHFETKDTWKQLSEVHRWIDHAETYDAIKAIHVGVHTILFLEKVK
jgi:hypothetical protein